MGIDIWYSLTNANLNMFQDCSNSSIWSKIKVLIFFEETECKDSTFSYFFPRSLSSVHNSVHNLRIAGWHDSALWSTQGTNDSFNITTSYGLGMENLLLEEQSSNDDIWFTVDERSSQSHKYCPSRLTPTSHCVQTVTPSLSQLAPIRSHSYKPRAWIMFPVCQNRQRSS